MVRLFDAGQRDDRPALAGDRILTAPNVISLVRLACLPVFVWLVAFAGQLLAGFWLIGAIAATDWVDGFIARRFDQVSRLGQLLDPFVDRALLATVSLTLLFTGIMPWWVVVGVVGRDALLLVGAAVLFGGRPTIAVSRVGKVATALLYVGIPAFLLAEAVESTRWRLFAVGTSVGALTAYWAAGILYVQAAVLLLRAERIGSSDAPASHEE